jgi:hypothetical protein
LFISSLPNYRTYMYELSPSATPAIPERIGSSNFII